MKRLGRSKGQYSATAELTLHAAIGILNITFASGPGGGKHSTKF